jgi:hypothetical protein
MGQIPADRLRSLWNNLINADTEIAFQLCTCTDCEEFGGRALKPPSDRSGGGRKRVDYDRGAVRAGVGVALIVGDAEKNIGPPVGSKL